MLTIKEILTNKIALDIGMCQWFETKQLKD